MSVTNHLKAYWYISEGKEFGKIIVDINTVCFESMKDRDKYREKIKKLHEDMYIHKVSLNYKNK